jgi:ketosteroid isomerase-like protein
MTDRSAIEGLLQELYSARLRGDLNALCACFTEDATLRISGASDSNPILIQATGLTEFRRMFSMMIKSFKLSEYASLSMLVDGRSAASHWSVRIHSRITGLVVNTELIDLVEVREGRIATYTEFFVPR